jgi:ABC-type multidrug transport system ATPase subunit
VIRFHDVAFSYQQGEPVFKDLNLELGPGLTMVLGLNGCGKSTLLKMAAGVERPDSGQIFIDGHNLWKEEIAARRSLAFLPEQPDLTPYATILEILRLVCRLRHESLEAANQALEVFSLTAVANRSVRELSLGQRRRATFAAAFIGSPMHILLDEPLEAMDRQIQGEILDWVRARVRAGATVAVVSHAIEQFFDLVTQAVGLKDGKAAGFFPLPENREENMNLLERLARGEYNIFQ